MDVFTMALWGLAGAFIYAGPRFVVAWTDPGRATRGNPLLELAMALCLGPIAASGFGQFVASVVHMVHQPEQRALCVVLGMIANPVAPALVEIFGNTLMRRLGAPGYKKEAS